MTVRTNQWLKDHFLEYDPDEYNRDLVDSMGDGPWYRAVDCYFVDSTDASASDSNPGTDPEEPFATIEGAINSGYLSAGDILYVMPGHIEDLGAGETIDFDVAGIHVIGIGAGKSKPRIDFNDATAGVNVGANNVMLRGLRFQPGITDVAIGVDVEADVTGTVIEGCEFMPGEDGAGVDEFILAVELKAGAHDTVIKNCQFYTHASAAGCTAAVKLTGASNRVIVAYNIMQGNWSTAAVHNDTAACGDLVIADNIMKVADGEPGIELHVNTVGRIAHNLIASTGINADVAIVAADCEWFENYAVEADGETAILIGTPSDDPTTWIGRNSADNDADTSLIAANEDGSVLERLEQLQEVVNRGSGTSAPANKSLYDILGTGYTDSGAGEEDTQSIREHLVAFAGGGTGSALPTNKALYDILGAGYTDSGAGEEDIQSVREHLIAFLGGGTGTALGTNLSLVDALGTDGTTVVDAATNVIGAIGVNDADNAFASTSVVANRDGSVLERLEALIYGADLPRLVGTVFYCDPTNGNDANNGLSPNLAVATIQAAIDLCTASKGDVIVRMPGTEQVDSAVAFNKAGITVVACTYGLNQHNPEEFLTYTAAGYTTGPCFLVSAPTTFIGIEVSTRATAANYTDSMTTSGSCVAIVGDAGAYTGGFNYFLNCRFVDWFGTPYGIEFGAGAYNEIRGCTFEGFDAGVAFRGTTNRNPDHNRVIECHFVDCTNGIEHLAHGCTAHHLLYKSNTFVDYTDAFDSNGLASDGLICDNWYETQTDAATYDVTVANLLTQGMACADNHYRE